MHAACQCEHTPSEEFALLEKKAEAGHSGSTVPQMPCHQHATQDRILNQSLSQSHDNCNRTLVPTAACNLCNFTYGTVVGTPRNIPPRCSHGEACSRLDGLDDGVCEGGCGAGAANVGSE